MPVQAFLFPDCPLKTHRPIKTIPNVQVHEPGKVVLESPNISEARDYSPVETTTNTMLANTHCLSTMLPVPPQQLADSVCAYSQSKSSYHRERVIETVPKHNSRNMLHVAEP